MEFVIYLLCIVVLVCTLYLQWLQYKAFKRGSKLLDSLEAEIKEEKTTWEN